MQLLAKFKNILYMGFGATLNFRKFKVALNPMYRIFLTLPKVASCHAYHALKAEIKGVFSRSYCCYAMVCVTKLTPKCSPVIGQFCDTMIVASSDKDWQ